MGGYYSFKKIELTHVSWDLNSSLDSKPMLSVSCSLAGTEPTVPCFCRLLCSNVVHREVNVVDLR